MYVPRLGRPATSALHSADCEPWTSGESAELLDESTGMLKDALLHGDDGFTQLTQLKLLIRGLFWLHIFYR